MPESLLEACEKSSIFSLPCFANMTTSEAFKESCDKIEELIRSCQQRNGISYIDILGELLMRLSAPNQGRVGHIAQSHDAPRTTPVVERALLMSLRVATEIEVQLRPRSPMFVDLVGSIFLRVPAVHVGARVPQQPRNLMYRGSLLLRSLILVLYFQLLLRGSNLFLQVRTGLL